MKTLEPNLEVEQVFLRMPCCIWWIDRNHNILGCNIETCAAFRAYSPEEILGKPILEIAKDKDLSEFKAKLIYDSDERLMESGSAEYQIKNMIPHHITESPKKQLGAKQPIFNKSGEVIGLVCVVLFDHDVNKEFKKDFEHGDLEMERFKVDFKSKIPLIAQEIVNFGFKEIFEITPCSLFWMNRKHVYLGCNLETCVVLQLDSQNEFTGKNLHNVTKAKNWSEFKVKNISELDEFIMKTGIPEFTILALLPQKNNKPSIYQLGSKKAVLNKKKQVIGLMGAAIYDGKFGVSEKRKSINSLKEILF